MSTILAPLHGFYVVRSAFNYLGPWTLNGVTQSGNLYTATSGDANMYQSIAVAPNKAYSFRAEAKSDDAAPPSVAITFISGFQKFFPLTAAWQALRMAQYITWTPLEVFLGGWSSWPAPKTINWRNMRLVQEVEPTGSNFIVSGSDFSTSSWVKNGIAVTGQSKLTATAGDDYLFQDISGMEPNCLYRLQYDVRSDSPGGNIGCTFGSLLPEVTPTASWQTFSHEFNWEGTTGRLYIGGWNRFMPPETYEFRNVSIRKVW